MNWNKFAIKNENKEEWAFEQMAYLLFCSEFDNNIGLFRYKNQTGIETEPLVHDGVIYGFSAKYYEVSISERKNEIIEAIEKAKNKNPELDTIHFYVNKELSESSKKDRKKAKYEIEIDEACKKLGVSLEWRVPSHFELQLALPKHKYIYDLFFSLDPTLDMLRDNVFEHNTSILKAIRTEISVDDKKIKIGRQNYISKIQQSAHKGEHIILSGEGGSGKTAVVKEFYQQLSADTPICIFKATELNISHFSDLFRFEHNFSVADFFTTYESEATKIFVIDSAEKLAELSNQTVLNDLIDSLIKYGWTIVFTTRTSYLDDLRYHINESYQLQCTVLQIELLSADELDKLSLDYEIELPSNSNFKDRLRNLFYLNEYITHYQGSAPNGNFSSFVELLWKRKIQNDLHKKDNLHIKRGRSLEYIAKERADTNRFYIAGDALSQDALYQLKMDDILGYDEQYDGYFITHDIYEEWALNHVINKAYKNYVSIEDFFNKLGESLAIRRAFRLWLSQKLIENKDNNIKDFINNIFIGDVNKFWKDELLVSVLLSEYSVEFFKIFNDELKTNNFATLKRILFLLRVACKDVVGTYQTAKPKGKGWQATIEFVYQHYIEFFDNNRKIVLPILLDWCEAYKIGETTRLAGLLAISVLENTEQGQLIYSRNNTSIIYKIIFASCNEIKKELLEIFDKVVKQNWVEHTDPYQDFCVTILTKCYLAVPLIQLLPESIIQLCEVFWTKEKDEDPYRISSFNMHSETDYGLKEYGFDYSPASAYQTPIYWLLRTDIFLDVINFITSFINSKVINYAHSDTGRRDVQEVKIYVQNNELIQYNSFALWTMYRGHGSPLTPELLQSIHMALEKFLFELVDVHDSKLVQLLLVKIIEKSNSTSLTSVVTSIVLAHPDKFYEIALVLFKSINLFYYDLIRSKTEFEAKSIYGMGYTISPDLERVLYRDERLKTCEEEHRSSNLENLCLYYQFHGVKGFTEKQNSDFIQNIFKIIDEHKSNLNGEDETESILLARIDRRNLEPEIVEDEETTKIFLKPKLTGEQRRISDTAEAEHNKRFRYTKLSLWSDFLKNKDDNSSEQYYENPLSALEDINNLIKELEQESTDIFDTFNRTAMFNGCAKLIIEHSGSLSDDEKSLCKDVIISSIRRLFKNNYDYQINDGLESCTHALPALIKEYPEDSKELTLALILILFDKRSIGYYKRVCDYVIETVHQYKLWVDQPNIAEQITNGFIRFKPFYNNAVRIIRNSDDFQYGKTISNGTILEKMSELFNHEKIEESLGAINIDINELNNFEIDDLEVIYQLLPNNTSNKEHLTILNSTLPNIAEILFKDRRETTNINNLYKLRLGVFKKVSAILLYRNSEDEIKELLGSFIRYLKRNDETEQFIERFVWAENDFYQPKVFWYVWKLIYPEIIKLYSQDSYFHDFDNLIMNYLLAWRWWGERQKEWRSLTKDNLWLYSDISKDLGNHPSVLYSIAKVLNSIASNFHDQGIDWVNTIVINHSNLKLGKVELDTLFYLENYLRQYVFLNRQSIRQNVRLKNKVITILDFMVERGSVHGYQLRESIL